MAKKDLRAQMDAARAAAAYIGARPRRIWRRPRGGSPLRAARRDRPEKDGAKAAPRRSRTHEVRSASLDVTQAAASPIFSPRTIRKSLGARQSHRSPTASPRC